MAFGLKQDDLVKIGLVVGGLALIGVLGIGQEAPVAPVRAAPKPYTGTGGATGFDVSQAYQGEEDDYGYDDYDSYQGEEDDDGGDDDYYSYPGDIVTGDHTGMPGPVSHPGPRSRRSTIGRSSRPRSNRSSRRRLAASRHTRASGRSSRV